MNTPKARVVSLITTDSKIFKIFTDIPSSHIHSYRPLYSKFFKFVGEIPIIKFKQGDILAVIDTYAVKQRNKIDASIKQRVTGHYEMNGKIYYRKVVAIIRETKIFVATECAAGTSSFNISEMSPVIATGLKEAHRKLYCAKKFSSPNPNQKSA